MKNRIKIWIVKNQKSTKENKLKTKYKQHEKHTKF